MLTCSLWVRMSTDIELNFPEDYRRDDFFASYLTKQGARYAHRRKAAALRRGKRSNPSPRSGRFLNTGEQEALEDRAG